VADRIDVCRKCKRQECLVDILEKHDHALVVRHVRCQKICHGPVVGLEVDGRMEWFERVDDVSSIAALLRLVRHPARGKIPKPLRKHRLKRRSGRPTRT
jgi:hypothetical protein